MGRVEVDLRELAREVSHNLWRPIKDGEGSLNIIITITATSKADSPSNLANWNPDARHEQQLEEKYVRLLFEPVWIALLLEPHSGSVTEPRLFE